MTLDVFLYTRDFSLPLLSTLHKEPRKLTWSALGGPDSAIIDMYGESNMLFETANLLRCPITLRDACGVPVWWGFVDAVTVHLEGVTLKVSLEQVVNRVKVTFAFISPDNKLADQLETTWVDHLFSQSEYGVKEAVLHRLNIDEDFAEVLRGTYLSAHAYPKTALSSRVNPNTASATLSCSGWFKTLSWVHYASSRGFEANYNGPGAYNFGVSASLNKLAQQFQANGSLPLKYAYFMIRKEGSPTRNIFASVVNSVSGRPGSTIRATSDTVSYNDLDAHYQWVKFTFSTPTTLTHNNLYWVILDPNGTDSSHYFSARIDETLNYVPNREGMVLNGSTWVDMANITDPGKTPPMLFRFVSVEDTGAQLYRMATDGVADQFIPKVSTFSTGVFSCPYRDNGFTCWQEITALMNLGTSNNRRVLAELSPQRHLSFYEQPSPASPTAILNRLGHFYTHQMVRLKPYFPPIGEWVRYSGSARLSYPWDKRRIPTCFVSKAHYLPATDQLIIPLEV